MGIPAASAFCTISNEARPLTRRTCRFNGNNRSRNARPITLSTALWRPNVCQQFSIHHWNQKLLRHEFRLCARNRPAPFAIFPEAIVTISISSRTLPNSIAGKFCRISSMLVLPHKPQLDANCSENVGRSLASLSRSAARSTITLLSLSREIFSDRASIAHDRFGQEKTSGEFIVVCRACAWS